MNNRINYTLVGFMVLLGLVSILGFSYWMLKPSDEKKMQIYSIYFDESVFGLNIDAPVKYRGISVGKVTYLRIRPTNSEQVEAQVTILKSTPIKEDTVARLTAQGITGLTYINLSLGHNTTPLLTQKKEDNYPVIKTVPSFFENIEQSLGSVSVELSKTLSGTQKLLRDKNQDKITKILQNTSNISAKINQLLNDKTIKNMQKTSENLESLTRKLDELVPNVNNFLNKSVSWEKNIDNSLSSIMTSYKGISASMGVFKRAVSNGELNIKDIGADVMPTINNTFLELERLIIQVEGTLEQYKHSPSDILYKKEEINKAPGEF